MKAMILDDLVDYIIDVCKTNKFNKVYICGNCGSGKTTLSKTLRDKAVKYGRVNLISTDDFMVDINLRKNSIAKWEDNGIIYEGRYTSSNLESYFLKNIYEIIYNIDHGKDCYYFPRKYKEKNNIRELKSNYFLTIIEGVGTVFLEKEKKTSLNILLKCSEDIEKKRLLERTTNLLRDASELHDEKRSSQFRLNVLKYESDFDLVILNDDKFNYNIINK